MRRRRGRRVGCSSSPPVSLQRSDGRAPRRWVERGQRQYKGRSPVLGPRRMPRPGRGLRCTSGAPERACDGGVAKGAGGAQEVGRGCTSHTHTSTLNFRESPKCELRRIPLPRTLVNGGARGRPLPQPSGPSSSNDPGLLPLVDPVHASVGAPEVAIGVVHLLVASDLAQELASGLSQFL